MDAGSSEIDLTRVESFCEGAPHAFFTRLRRESPVYWHPESEGPGFWAVTRHADVVAVGRDAETFSSHARGTMIHDTDFDSGRAAMMIELDPPQHTRYRGLVNRGFTPRRVASLEPFARELVAGILDRALAQRRCDFVRDVAAELPLQLILELMGVPPGERAPMFDLANRVMGFDDPEYVGEDSAAGENTEAIAEMFAFGRTLAERKADAPGDDLASALLTVEIDGEKLSADEFDSFFMLLVTAGSETTRSAISGGWLAFEEFPEQWERLQGDPSLLPTAVEELLRWTTPIHHFRRTAMRDTELGGQAIRAGDKVVLWYTSANRDEAVFEDPFRFDVGRQPNDHLSFGIGRHFCLGANLARLEIRVMLEGLLARGVVPHTTAPPEWMASNFAHSIKRLPAILEPAA